MHYSLVLAEWRFSVFTMLIPSVIPRFCTSFLTASFCSHVRSKKLQGGNGSQQFTFPLPDKLKFKESIEDNLSSSPGSSKSFGETQLEIFHHCHGLLMLHLVAAVMFAPSLVAWLQV